LIHGGVDVDLGGFIDQRTEIGGNKKSFYKVILAFFLNLHLNL
jgi:hypothetical protein